LQLDANMNGVNFSSHESENTSSSANDATLEMLPIEVRLIVVRIPEN